MRRAKMMLKPKLGPSVKQNQPQQLRPQTPQVVEQSAPASAASETALMPPPPTPPLHEECEQPPSPKRLKTTVPEGHVVQDSPSQSQTAIIKETPPSMEVVVSHSTGPKTVATRPRTAKVSGDQETSAPLPALRERKPTKKADEFREMLMASRRRFGKVREPIDTSKLTMLDLIYYNPPGAPMRRKTTEAEKPVEKLEEQSLEPELEEESNSADPAKAATEEELMGPRVVVGPDGEIQIDETSLVIRRPDPLESKHKLKITVEEAGKARYNSFKTKKMKKCTWTSKETSNFYQALSICGTDFTLMTQFFPSRSRQDLKNKFKREEKLNAALIDKAIHHPTQFEYTDFELEDIAKDDTEPQRTKSTRSSGKGSRKRKPKLTESVENELSELADAPSNEKLSSLRVSRPRRNRARVDYSALQEPSQDLDDAPPAARIQEEEVDGTQAKENATLTAEQSPESNQVTLESNQRAQPECSSNSIVNREAAPTESRSRSINEPPTVFEVPEEVIDEVAQIREQIQSQESVRENPTTGAQEVQPPVEEKPPETTLKVPARKIPAPVFKPRHRKAAIRPNEPKRSNVPKSLPAVVLPSTGAGTTDAPDESGSNPLEKQKPSDTVLKIYNSITPPHAIPGSQEVAETDLSESPTSATEVDILKKLPELGTTTSSPARITIGSPPVREKCDPIPSSSLAPNPKSESFEPSIECPAGTKTREQTANSPLDEIDKVENEPEDSKPATLPKLVLPSRPISNRIIRPIGAATTRGVVLSPMTKRRLDSAKQDS